MSKTLKQILSEAALAKTKAADRTPAQQEQHAAGQAKASDWHAQNPVNHMNIVDHYDSATPEEHHDGKHWYKDAQHFSKAVAKSTGVPHHTVAGLTANYSPQTDWHTNMLTASRVARHKKATGGVTQKPYYKYGKTMASEKQKEAAQRMLDGDHHDSVLKGFKTRAFAHLIEHGGDADHNDPQVAVDRHAHSVASGARITDAAFGVAGLKGKKKYDELKNSYVQAAAHINGRNNAKLGDDHYVHPHQVQAVTWLVRQRRNNQEDLRNSPKETEEKMIKAGKARDTAKAKWGTYSGTWHPELQGKFKE
jgi:hypothetical protein